MIDETYEENKENEEDCGADFASPLTYTNSGYTLDYSLANSGRGRGRENDDNLVTPEPSMILLVLIGFILILFKRRRYATN